MRRRKRGRGAGKHPSYALIRPCFAARCSEPMPAGLLSPEWSPAAFVSAVKRQAGKPGPEREILRLVQAAESRALAEWILQSC